MYNLHETFETMCNFDEGMSSLRIKSLKEKVSKISKVSCKNQNLKLFNY